MEPGTADTLLESQIIETLKTVFDPEIPVNIYELGLIYDIKISPEKAVTIRMTLTAPNCPVAESLPVEVRDKVRSIPGVTDAAVEMTFEPPWEPSRMSEAAKLELGFF
jgi:FeS assembly SUF system protein